MRAKREPEKHPLLSRRGRHEKGAARPFQTPKERSKRKKASRCAKSFFSRFSDLLLRSGCYVFAGREVQRRREIFGGAVNGRSTKNAFIAIFKNKANSRRNGTSLSSQKAKLSEKHIVSRSEEHPESVFLTSSDLQPVAPTQIATLNAIAAICFFFNRIKIFQASIP